MINPDDVMFAVSDAAASFIWLHVSTRATGWAAMVQTLLAVALAAACAAHLVSIAKALGWL